MLRLDRGRTRVQRRRLRVTGELRAPPPRPHPCAARARRHSACPAWRRSSSTVAVESGSAGLRGRAARLGGASARFRATLMRFGASARLGAASAAGGVACAVGGVASALVGVVLSVVGLGAGLSLGRRGVSVGRLGAAGRLGRGTGRLGRGASGPAPARPRPRSCLALLPSDEGGSCRLKVCRLGGEFFETAFDRRQDRV